MTGRRKIQAIGLFAALAVLGGAASPLTAQRRPAPPRPEAPRPAPASPAAEAKTPAPSDKPDNAQAAARGADNTGSLPHAGLGGGIEQLSRLPYDQQVQQLNADPNFKKLPADQQKKMLQQLQRFDQLPADQQRREIQRLHDLGQLSPEQRAGLANVFNQFQTMPQTRRQGFRQAFNRLNRMSDQDREIVLNGKMFQSAFGFTPAEMQTLRQALALKLPPDVIGQAPNPNLPH